MKILSVVEVSPWPNSGTDRRLLGTVPQVYARRSREAAYRKSHAINE